MTRCCCCDYDPLTPSPFFTSISGGRRGRVHYRRKLKDFYCESCYSVVVTTVTVADLRDKWDTDIMNLLTGDIKETYDAIREDTLAVSLWD